MVGLGVVVVGVLLRYFPVLFSWFGNLPGDIKRQSGNTQVFVPITSMLVVSLGATLIINVLARLLRD
ncbi:MAG TPA: DUF2905 domain-containing protein [Acidimicrobiia bacterium]|nr:DUF2905 domain-containing protein [Acidimicrobiia bacterium]